MAAQANPVTDDSQTSANTRQLARIDRPAIQPNCYDNTAQRVDLQPILLELCEFAAELLEAPTTAAEPLMSVVENIRAEAQLHTLDRVLAILNEPIDLPDARRAQTALRSPTLRCVLADGLRTAWLAANLLPSFGLPGSTHETLLIAALLQDIGIAVLAERRNVTSEQLELKHRAVYHKHPQIGAALAAGIRRCASDLPTLIAEHHERLNGTGYPAGRRARQFTSSSRFLQIVCHFTFRVREHSDPMAVNIENACVDLEQQTLRGWFDRGLADILLRQIHESVSAPLITAPAAPIERQAVPAPKFLRRRRSEVDLGVFVQSTAESDTVDRTLPPNY